MPTIYETEFATDVTATTGTVATMSVGDYFYGTAESSFTDSDWIAINLTAGTTYTFAMTGIGALSEGVDDPFLHLYNASGYELSSDDDSGPSYSSTLTFTASYSGTYYLGAEAFSSVSGDYAISATEGTWASYDLGMGASNLLRDDYSWSSTAGSPATVTWGIRTSDNGFETGGTFAQLSTSQINFVTSVMEHLEDITGLTLTQVNPGGTTNAATILFGSYSSSTDGSGAYAYYPGSTLSSNDSGDVWLNRYWVDTTISMGSYDYFTILHEVGHALGLSHPGEYNAGTGVSITYYNSAQFIEDSNQYSVMSYFDASETSSSVGGTYPDTYLLHDVYALQLLYGADYSYNSGDTTYGFNATVSGPFDFDVNTTPFLTIWDGAGTDTIDLSQYAMSQSLNLNDGTFSSVGGYDTNLSIAIGAEIENAVGGSAADTIYGNELSNTINSGSGNDYVTGDEGNDRLTGALGDDWLEGGNGNDILYGEQGDDHLEGGAGNDQLNGGTGADYIDGGDGRDMVSYYSSTAAINFNLTTLAAFGGDADGDTLLNIEAAVGSAYADTMVSGNENATFWGYDGNDRLFGEGGNDTLYGQGGNDQLNGGAGADYIDGGDGRDSVSFYSSDAAINFNLGTLVAFGGHAEGDTLLNIEGATGSAYSDTMISGNENATFFGYEGNDRLFGEGGNDTLYGQGGNDQLNGGTGADYIDGGDGIDTVSYYSSDAAVNFNLATLVAFGGHATGDTLLNIEASVGSAYADTMISGAENATFWGYDGNDRLFGQGGNDRLLGQGGDDQINGGTGNDTIDGGAGVDRFVFDTAAFGDDIIQSFDLDGNDYLDFRGSGLSASTMLIAASGANTLVTFSGNIGHSLIFTNLSSTSLDTSDWLF